MTADTHSLVMPPNRAIPIADWMAALFEVQDTLMVAGGGGAGD
jgi:hypothetical protein